MKTLERPFTEKQAASINEYQMAKYVHPFTCPVCNAALIAITKHGMECPKGHYEQDWVWAMMADGSWKKFGNKMM